jgi:hypothetical protein
LICSIPAATTTPLGKHFPKSFPGDALTRLVLKMKLRSSLSSWSVLFRRKMGTKPEPEQQVCNAGAWAAPDSHFPAMHRLKRKNFEDQKVMCALDRVSEFSHAGVLLSMSGKQPVASHF